MNLRPAASWHERFAYEWHDDSGNWFRPYGNENWEYREDGLMAHRLACITIFRSKKPTGNTSGR
jgi:nuclear transport factor 2 (NTF2) superfamily protein